MTPTCPVCGSTECSTVYMGQSARPCPYGAARRSRMHPASTVALLAIFIAAFGAGVGWQISQARTSSPINACIEGEPQ